MPIPSFNLVPLTLGGPMPAARREGETPEDPTRLRFVLGCDINEFRGYYGNSGWAPRLGETEEMIIRQMPAHLIVFRLDGTVVGHAIWHKSDTRAFRPGEPREPMDTQILEELLGGPAEFLELHELWLMEEYRGRGYGSRFFDFFESFVAGRGYEASIYYAFDPAAVALCRRRGYPEGYGVEAGGETNYVFRLPALPRR